MLLALLYAYLISPINHFFILKDLHPHPPLSLPPHHDEKNIAGITVRIQSICWCDVTTKPLFRPNDYANEIMNSREGVPTQKFRFFSVWTGWVSESVSFSEQVSEVYAARE